MTLAERINTPKGYTREEAEKGSLVEFLRKYSLKKSTGVVKTWDGKKAKDITNTPAVFKLPLAKGESSVGRRFRDSIIYRVFVGKSNV